MLNRLLAASILLVALPAAAADLYRSDFTKPPEHPASLAAWDLGGAGYTRDAGWLVVKSERSNPYARRKSQFNGDTFTYRATVRNARSCHWAALLAQGRYRLEVNNQFVRLALYIRDGADWKLVSQADGYEMYPHNTQTYELRLVRQGNRVSGFIDDKKLVEARGADGTGVSPAGNGGTGVPPVPTGRDARSTVPPVPPDFALMSGWGTNLAWRSISLSDTADLHEWPYETLPTPGGRDLIEVTQVRGLSQEMPFDNLYFDGETAGLRIKLRARKPGLGRVSLRFRLIDVRQRQVAVQWADVALTPNAETEVPMKFRPPARGCFKVALDAGAAPGKEQWVEDVGGFTVVARALNDRPRIADSYFGGHMDGIHLAWHLRVGRKIGIQWARCHDMMQWTWWDRIQPQGPDEWKWGDEAQKTVDAVGMGTSGEFLWVPKWAWGAKPDAPGNHSTYPPRNMDDFARYVYETVSHYKGSIHYWEMWNEPHFSGFFSGSPVDYAQMLQIAYREAKRADPTCTVLGVGGVNPRSHKWIEQMVAALPTGGPGVSPGQDKGKDGRDARSTVSGVPPDKCMDGFTIHYLEPDYGPTVVSDLCKLLAPHLGAVSPFPPAERGPGGEVLWNSEETVMSTSFFDQCRATHAEPEARYHFRNACCELVRTYMENIACGVRRIFYYDQADPWRFKPFPKARVFDPSPIGGTMWDEGQMLKPIAAAHAALALAIDGKPYVTRITRGALQAFVFGKDGTPGATAVQYATYSTFSRTVYIQIKPPAGARAADYVLMDFMGNEMTLRSRAGLLVLPLAREPVYLTCKRLDGLKVLQSMYEAVPPQEAL